jgi:hypothetical protein
MMDWIDRLLLLNPAQTRERVETQLGFNNAHWFVEEFALPRAVMARPEAPTAQEERRWTAFRDVPAVELQRRIEAALDEIGV